MEEVMKYAQRRYTWYKKHTKIIQLPAHNNFTPAEHMQFMHM